MTRNAIFLSLLGFLLPWAAVADDEAVTCSDHSIAASAVRTPSDVQAFVQCAAEYLREHGTAEARRAFNEDERWNHGPMYVFVDGIAKSGAESIAYVFPPDPSREGTAWGTTVDGFGNDLFYELYRTMSIVDSGWVYYSFQNPETGTAEPKTSYVIEVDWDGQRAAVGAGIYAPDLPGTCNADEVDAAGLAAAPSEENLQAFVRCAAMLVAEKGYFARGELETGSRWSHGSIYVFVMDLEGNQLLTGNNTRLNGKALHEWGGKSRPTDQFGGRDMAAVGDAFGEALIYYRGRNPMTGTSHQKVSLIKRVVAHGVPVIVGAGYDAESEPVVPQTACDDNKVTARGIRTRRDVQAFVRCAAEYVQTHGPEEARRAFHEDDRWRHGPYYVFVDLIGQPHERPISHIAVFPPNPSWEGTSQLLVDNFGTDYFDELHRVMTFGDSGWVHYAFTNFVTGRSEPKSSYVVEVDWEGHRAVVGTGVYLRDLPGTCESEEVNAAGLAADPSDERLQELVRCAALEMESRGFFAKATLASDPRWKSGSVYVFGLDTHGTTLFGPQSSMGASELSPASDASFGGRDFVSTANTFGETFVYYLARNPSTDMQERKVTLVKRAMVQGLPVLVGAGYYPDHSAVTGPPGVGPGGGQVPGSGDSGSAGQGDTATLRYWQAPTILNPYLSRGTKEAEAASLVLEPLAEFNPDGDLVAALATHIPTLANGGVSDDRTSITWTLREGVTWSDGTPLSADDVVFTWQYCTAPGGGCANAARFENVASVEAVDEHTVTVVFTGPVSFPYAPFVSASSPILQASQFSGCLGAAAAGCTDANHGPVGTGPYVVAEFHSNESVRYRFNPRYRGVAAGLPYFREVLLQGGGDAVAAARSVLELNEADYAWNLQIDPETLNSLVAGGGGTVVSAFATSVERLMLNQTNPDPSLGDLRSEYADGTNPHPFLTDPVVGRALSLAIDRSELVRIGYGDLAGRPTCNVWPAPPEQVSTNNDECLVQDLELAAEILDDAGIVDSDGDGVREREGVPLRVLFQTSTNSVRQATQEHIKRWWAEIGVETELKHVSGSVFFSDDPNSPDTVGKFYADVQMYTNSSSGPDPESYLGSWITAEMSGAANSFLGRNVQRFQSDEFDRLHGELHNTVDQDKRNELTIALNDLIVGSYSIIPLVYRGLASAHANDIEGVWMNAWDSELWNFETWWRHE